MKILSESSFYRLVEMTIILVSILVIGYMIIGGCGGDGGHKEQPTPPPTGPPPGCEDIDIDPECPAVSLTELCDFWGGYSCDFTEIKPDITEPETISLGIQLTACTSLDCFTLECDEIFSPDTQGLLINLNIMELETVSDIIPVAFSGTADIDGDEFEYVCNPPPIP